MILYILLVAMLNVGLGFGVAVYLGRRYNQLLADDEPWESMPFGESTSLDPAAEPEPTQTEATDVDEEETNQPPQPEADEVATEAAEPDKVAPQTAETDEATPELETAPPTPAATGDGDDTSETDTSETDTTEAGTTEADTTEAGATEAGTTEADTTEAGITEVGTTEADTTEADTTEIGATEPDTSEPDTTDPDTSKASTTEADITEVDTSKASTTEADITEADTSEASTTEAVTTEADTTEPETAAPLASESAGPEEASEPADQKGLATVAATTLKIDVEQFQEQLMQLCDELRSQAEAPDASEVGTCLDSLAAATGEYLENSKRPRAALDQLCQEPELEKVGRQVQQSIQQHDEQAESFNAAVAAMDRQGDLAAGCRSIAEKSDALLSAGHQLRDNLDEAAAKAAESDGTADKTDPAARTDPQTGLFNRAGLEAYLAQWWEKDPERTRQLGAAMIDADEFAAVNAQFGYKTGNRLLGAIGKLLEAEIKAGVVARFSGQRFFLLFPDGNARAATNGVERVRQMIAKARFLHHDTESRVTVSCASTAAIPDDTSASLIARTEMALQEAKRYGRNRTFLHEGEYPAPVVPPQFTFEERQIRL